MVQPELVCLRIRMSTVHRQADSPRDLCRVAGLWHRVALTVYQLLPQDLAVGCATASEGHAHNIQVFHEGKVVNG